MTTAIRLRVPAGAALPSARAAIEHPLARRVVEAQHRRAERHAAGEAEIDRRDRFVGERADLRERRAPRVVAGRRAADASSRADAARRRRWRRRTLAASAPIASATPSPAALDRAHGDAGAHVAAARARRTAPRHRESTPTDRPRGPGSRCRARVPANAARSTCANICADARSGGVLSAARHSGSQIAGERAARRAGEALRPPSRPAAQRKSCAREAAEIRRSAPMRSRQRQSARREHAAGEMQRRRRAPGRELERAAAGARRRGAASAAADGTARRRPRRDARAASSASVCR